MTSTDLKALARAYMQEHDVNYTFALRAVTPSQAWDSWDTGNPPWLRGARFPFVCYWCGNETAVLSWGDLGEDAGRVEFYCQHPDCTAREVDVVVVDDGTEPTRDRADVRALSSNPGEAMSDPVFFTDSDVPSGYMFRSEPQPAARNAARSRCLFCGDLSCVPTRRDNWADIGRLELRCTNTRCHAAELVALVGRDGTATTTARADVTALREIDDPPLPRSATPAQRIRPVGHRTDGALDRRRA